MEKRFEIEKGTKSKDGEYQLTIGGNLFVTTDERRLARAAKQLFEAEGITCEIIRISVRPVKFSGI